MLRLCLILVVLLNYLTAYKPKLYMVNDDFERYNYLVLGHPNLINPNSSSANVNYTRNCGSSLDPAINSLVVNSINSLVDIEHIDKAKMGQLIEHCNKWYPSPQTSLVVPSTKWCGTGNQAKSDNDLGESEITDQCCYEHDHCPDYIMPMEARYGLVNLSPFCRSHCECDEKFFNCLKKASTKEATAEVVGRIYFNLLKMKCFVEDYPKKCVQKRRFGIPGLSRCIEYEKDLNSAKVYQFVHFETF